MENPVNVQQTRNINRKLGLAIAYAYNIDITPNELVDLALLGEAFSSKNWYKNVLTRRYQTNRRDNSKLEEIKALARDQMDIDFTVTDRLRPQGRNKCRFYPISLIPYCLPYLPGEKLSASDLARIILAYDRHISEQAGARAKLDIVSITESRDTALPSRISRAPLSRSMTPVYDERMEYAGPPSSIIPYFSQQIDESGRRLSLNNKEALVNKSLSSKSDINIRQLLGPIEYFGIMA